MVGVPAVERSVRRAPGRPCGGPAGQARGRRDRGGDVPPCAGRNGPGSAVARCWRLCYQVLKDEGLQGASIAKIAKLIDAPPSLLIHYFGTKQQMTIELVDYLLEEYRQGYGDKLAAIPDSGARLAAILGAFFGPEYHHLLDDSVFYACFYLSLRHPDVRWSYSALYEGYAFLIGAALRTRARQLLGLPA